MNIYSFCLGKESRVFSWGFTVAHGITFIYNLSRSSNDKHMHWGGKRHQTLDGLNHAGWSVSLTKPYKIRTATGDFRTQKAGDQGRKHSPARTHLKFTPLTSHHHKNLPKAHDLPQEHPQFKYYKPRLQMSVMLCLSHSADLQKSSAVDDNVKIIKHPIFYGIFIAPAVRYWSSRPFSGWY